MSFTRPDAGKLARSLSVSALVAAALLLADAASPVRSQALGVGMFGAPKIRAESGREVFEQICQGCHMPDARGATGAGRYPALTGNPALASTKFMAVTLLEGRRNMPKFGGNGDVGLFFVAPTLDDEQIAAVINYIRTSFGNHFKDRITPAEVEALRP
jgi:mono/diheme cytochrome c family protein